MSKERNANPGARAGATGDECSADQLRPQDSTPAPQRKVYRARAEWRKRNPLAHWAHRAFENGLRRGLIEKQPCEECGASETDAHHDDYDRPLAVRWLCRRHHKALHAKRRAKP